MTTEDKINPNYYRAQKIQIIEVIRDMPFSLGNSIKYIYRCREKDNKIQDLKKASWYIKDHMTNGTQLEIKNSLDLFATSKEKLETLLAKSDDFEREAITIIHDSFFKNNDYSQALDLIEKELEK